MNVISYLFKILSEAKGQQIIRVNTEIRKWENLPFIKRNQVKCTVKWKVSQLYLHLSVPIKYKPAAIQKYTFVYLVTSLNW